MPHAERDPRPLLRERLAELCQAARRGPVLDLACGRGHNALFAARAGARVLAMDRDPQALDALLAAARRQVLPVQCVRADLETELGIPVRAGSCAAILVFRFLYRPLAPAICRALRPGGLLLYETFTVRQREFGHGPRNQAFLLHPGELPRLFADLEIEHYAEEVEPGPPPQALARLVARRPSAPRC